MSRPVKFLRLTDDLFQVSYGAECPIKKPWWRRAINRVRYMDRQILYMIAGGVIGGTIGGVLGVLALRALVAAGVMP